MDLIKTMYKTIDGTVDAFDSATNELIYEPTKAITLGGMFLSGFEGLSKLRDYQELPSDSNKSFNDHVYESGGVGPLTIGGISMTASSLIALLTLNIRNKYVQFLVNCAPVIGVATNEFLSNSGDTNIENIAGAAIGSLIGYYNVRRDKLEKHMGGLKEAVSNSYHKLIGTNQHQ